MKRFQDPQRDTASNTTPNYHSAGAGSPLAPTSPDLSDTVTSQRDPARRENSSEIATHVNRPDALLGNDRPCNNPMWKAA